MPAQLKNNVKSEFPAFVALPVSRTSTTQCFSVMAVMPAGTCFVLKARTLCLLCLLVPGFARLVPPEIVLSLLPFVHSRIVLKQLKVVPSVGKKKLNGTPSSPEVFTIACALSTTMSFPLTTMPRWLDFLSRTWIISHGYASSCTSAIASAQHLPEPLVFLFMAQTPGGLGVGVLVPSPAAAELQNQEEPSGHLVVRPVSRLEAGVEWPVCAHDRRLRGWGAGAPAPLVLLGP